MILLHITRFEDPVKVQGLFCVYRSVKELKYLYQDARKVINLCNFVRQCLFTIQIIPISEITQ